MKRAWLFGLIAACVSLRAQDLKRPAITGIAFARFYTTDPAGAEKFYGSTLGLKRTEVDGTWVYPVNRSQWVEILPTAPPKANVEMAAVGLTTRDAAGMERYLKYRGFPITVPLKKGEFGLRDPEGNLVMFVQSGSKKVVAKSHPSPSATSGRIIHAGFVVGDDQLENKFWMDVLGFRPYWHGGRTDARTDYVSLQVPDGSDWVEYMLNVGPNPTPQQVGGADHFSLGVAHMSDAVAALARNHCEGANCTKTQLGRDGKVQLNLFDPDHTRVEFMEFVPTREPCCSPFMGKHPTAVEDN